MAFCNQCGNSGGQRGVGSPFQMGPMGPGMNSPFGLASGGGNPMMQMMQMMMGMLMGMMAGQMLQQMMAQGGGQPFGQFPPGMSPHFGGMPGMGACMGGPGMGNFLGNGGIGGPGQAQGAYSGAHGPNTMTPPSSTGQIGALSQNRDERIRQVVDAAKRTYPDQPHMAKLAAAQALLESGIASSRGPSGLARDHNNLFGIKGRGTAGSVNMRTREVYGGQSVTIRDGFAKNATVEDSFQQHKNLMSRSRYRRVLGSQSFEQAAHEVRQAGYATDPNYSRSLISVYNQHLARYF